MTKFEKIKLGMELIKEGCSDVSLCNECEECPFDTYCTFIVMQNADELQLPSEWPLED